MMSSGQGPRLEMYQIDAFTNRIFAGNPAAVIILQDWLSDDLMQSIAAENNLAETAFIRPRSDGSHDLRWFTPVMEVDFCGHATLATAHALLAEEGAQAPLVFHTRIGTLQVEHMTKGYRLDVPALPPEPLAALPPEIAGNFSAVPTTIFRNFENIFVDLGSEAAVRAFRPDMTELAPLGRVGLVVTGRAEDGRADFVSRYFAPGAGIPEDPVTGSIHATLTPYWAGQLGKKRLTAYQASARGGWLECEIAGDRVYLDGEAVTFMKAVIALPG